MKKAKTLTLEKKYQLYEDSVQNFEVDIEFINKEFKKTYGKEPLVLREDFGGTAAMACSWTTQSDQHKAWGIDLDPEPIAYGRKVHYGKLTDDQKNRMHYMQGNVLDRYQFSPDVIVAFNFSYFIFKKRQQLLDYFKAVRKSLPEQGAFFVDIFGGTDCCQELEEKTKYDTHTYYWDCDSYNPLNNEVQYYIHFKVDGVKHKKVFSYDWRMWTVREVQEIMEDAGFKTVTTYWEEDDEDDEDGGGNGEFYRSTVEENCDSWVTYVVGWV